ncbi:MAG: PLD nuclease N-terminal domain-containing protein [Mycobacteriaceae bacterium]|uniref:PLD nuclease N-terminal domain-containing protein n=1 Tax=Corynebacterium sp. TaxID=1720 RepID=UPI003F98F045
MEIVLLSFAVWFGLMVSALVSVAKHPRLNGGGKAVWVLLVIALPVIAPVVWFLWGRKGSLDQP